MLSYVRISILYDEILCNVLDFTNYEFHYENYSPNENYLPYAAFIHKKM